MRYDISNIGERIRRVQKQNVMSRHITQKMEVCKKMEVEHETD